MLTARETAGYTGVTETDDMSSTLAARLLVDGYEDRTAIVVSLARSGYVVRQREVKGARYMETHWVIEAYLSMKGEA